MPDAPDDPPRDRYRLDTRRHNVGVRLWPTRDQRRCLVTSIHVREPA